MRKERRRTARRRVRRERKNTARSLANVIQDQEVAARAVDLAGVILLKKIILAKLK